MDTIKIDDLPQLFNSVSEIMSKNADRLCEMDANMGDGDLGLTMKKGFGALPEIISSLDEPDFGKKLTKAGMKMSSVVPSTMGTLMSSGIMSGGKKLIGKDGMDGKGLALFLRGYAEGIVKRGKCAVGERTVLDAISPAADAAEKAAANGATLCEIAEATVKGADNGVEATKNMVPVYGKAAVFSAKAIGIEDQGAVAGQLVIHGIRNYICK